MKREIFIASALVVSAMTALPALADQGNQNRGYHQSFQNRSRDRDAAQVSYRDQRGDRDRDNDYYHRDRDRDYEYRRPEHRPQGYRRQPHGRRYEHPYFGREHEYHYEGHWNSWEDWERYKRRHSERFRHGDYYREEGHLFFRFCDPEGGPCFFFSIGR